MGVSCLFALGFTVDKANIVETKAEAGGLGVSWSETKYKVSTDGNYALILTAFKADDVLANAEGKNYIIGYEINDEDALINYGKNYYESVALKTSETESVSYTAAQVFGAAYADYMLNVYEIQDFDVSATYNIQPFIKEITLSGDSGYTVVTADCGDSNAIALKVVTFNTNGAGEMAMKRVQNGTVLGELPVLEKEGFEFKGWAVDGVIIDPATYIVNGDIEVVAMFEEIKVSENLVEDFSDLSKFSYEQFAVGLNTKVTGISIVTNISNATEEEKAQANGKMYAVHVNTYLGQNCYVKTNFGGIIQNAFNTTDYAYLTVKAYIDHQPSRSWDRVYFGVGSNQAMVYERGWYELKITREDWAKDPYFWMQPNPSGAYDVNLIFTVYFDEITGGYEENNYFAVESFSDISKFSYEQFAVGLNTKVTGISVVTDISNATAEEKAQANGEMFAVQVNTWLGVNCYVKTNFGGIIQNAFDTKGFDCLIVKAYIDYQASSVWERVLFGVGSNQVMVYNRGWYELKITREEWVADPYFYMQPNPSGAYDINPVFTIYFDEITGGFEDLAAATAVKTIFEDFSDISKFNYEQFAVGTNTKVTGISVVTHISSNATEEEKAQLNGSAYAVSVNTWLGSACYVKTKFGGVIDNAFSATDADYIILKAYIDYQASSVWERVLFGVGSNQVMVYNRGWYELKITRADWNADPYFCMQPNPSGAYDINPVFTIYFDELYIETEAQPTNLVEKTGFTVEQLTGTYVEKEDGTKVVLTAEELVSFYPESGDKVVLVIKFAGYKPLEYVLNVI